LRKKPGSYEIYNLLEKFVIEIPLTPADQKIFTELDLEYLMIREIKGLAIQLSKGCLTLKLVILFI
jgi:hypothetical protein